MISSTVHSAKSKIFQFPEVRVVEASAGSGKTYALAKRYVQLLLKGNKGTHDLILSELSHVSPYFSMRQILAVTFTNKAALEMKARILDFLKKIALGLMPAGELQDIIEPIDLSPEEARTKSFALMEQVIRQYNFFQVQTIDSFIKTLLIGCAFKTGLTAGFRIRTNSPEYLEYALDELIDSAAGSKALRKTFEEFLHNYLYLENRTGWFPKKDMLDIIRGLFTQFNHYGLNFRATDVSTQELIKLKKSVLKDMKSLQKLVTADFDMRFVKSLEKFLAGREDGFDIDNVPAYFERAEPPLKKGTAPFLKGEKGRCPLFELWDKIHKNLKKVCEDEAYSLFNPYVGIFEQAMAAFAKMATKEDVLFLEELNRRAQDLFKQGDISVGELYYRLATRFRHYLLDEFQDTSRLQWKNIEPMAQEALASGGSLFYVGDKKQAIYSFRGGEVELFDEIRNGLNNYNVQVEPLAKNWRSQKAIVDFNNVVFSADNLKGFIQRKEASEIERKKNPMVHFSEEDIQVVERAFANSRQTCKEENAGGYVKAEHLDIDKKEQRDEVLRQKIVPMIKDLQKRFKLSDIAVLTRNNKEVEQVTGWLLAENIFVESDRTSNIRENPVIQELLAFLRFLDSPIDNLSFTQFILGDVFSRAVSGDTHLSPKGTGVCPQAMHDFVFSLRNRIQGEKDFYIYMAFREQYPKEWQALFEEFFKNVGLYPMYELVVTICSRFQCLKNFPEYQGFFMRFLELIKREEEDHSGIAAFTEYFENLEGEDLYVHLTDTDAVKITTVHKSKGLEFPVVILPFLCMDVQVGEGGGDNQQSYCLQKGEAGMELLRLKSKYYGYSDALYEIYAQEYKKAFLSELNNIYVALTRPMYELYIFTSNKIGNSHNPVRFLFREDQRESGKKGTHDLIRDGIKSCVPFLAVPPSEHHDWIGFLEDEFASFDQLKNRKQRLRGSVIHDLLSYVGNLSKGAPEEFLAKALEEAVYKYPDVDNLKEHLKQVAKIIATPAFKPYLYVEDGDVATEIDVVNGQGHTKRLDRLIIKEKEVWVVDFKSSALDAEGKYPKQVREYISILKELHPTHRVRGFLVYLDTADVTEVT